MKKLTICLMLFILISPTVNAKEKANTLIRNYQDEELIEEVFDEKDNNGKIKSFNIKITIPRSYNKEEIIIEPSIFRALNHFKRLEKETDINFNLEIINNSPNNYLYKNNSLLIVTEDLKAYDYNNNYKTTGAKSFTGENILSIYLPFRTKNSALNSLFNNKKYNLDNVTLNNRLKTQGYLGVSELDKYYLDFYNTKYNLNEKFLEDFPLFIKKEILDGEITEIKESNNNIIELAYDYFYSNIYTFGFSDDQKEGTLSKDFSIKNHYLNNIKDNYLNKNINKIESKKTFKLENMRICTNKSLMTDAFNDYNYYAHLEFKLIDEEKFIRDQGMIIPPDTGI